MPRGGALSLSQGREVAGPEARWLRGPGRAGQCSSNAEGQSSGAGVGELCKGPTLLGFEALQFLSQLLSPADNMEKMSVDVFQ